ncbi:MAG: hypothetical protein M1827_000524 [Pycnora praestabilis]|nr:MAG: hypothetical protein M1827_000524 [Pycnora praestabilis]
MSSTSILITDQDSEYEAFTSSPEEPDYYGTLRHRRPNSFIGRQKGARTCDLKRKSSQQDDFFHQPTKPRTSSIERFHTSKYDENVEDIPPEVIHANNEEDEDEEDDEVQEVGTRELRVGDRVEMDKFYDTKFLQLLQVNCKWVAKQWIKVIEPKKQTKYPYNGGKDKDPEKTKPPWWPRSIQHKEPDHNGKPDRVILLQACLRTRNDHCKSVKDLEKSTKDSTERITQDKGSVLKEIVRVRKKEEAFEDGAIDHDATIVVANVVQRPSVSRKPAKSSPEREKKGVITNSACSRNFKQQGSDRIDMRVKKESEESRRTQALARPQSPSALVPPIGHLGLQGDHQNPFFGRPRSHGPNNNAEYSYTGVESPPDHSRTTVASIGYEHNYVEQSPMHESPPFMDDHLNDVSNPSSSRSVPFQVSNSASSYREGLYSAAPPPAMAYGTWPSPSMNGNLPMNYPYTLPSAPPSQQHGVQQQYQLPPPQYGTSSLPPFAPHEISIPELPCVRGQPLYEGHITGAPFRTGSLSHPHHNLPQQGSGDFYYDGRAYGSMNSQLSNDKHDRIHIA